MALPASGWVSTPERAPLTRFPLPERATFEYRENWQEPEVAFRAGTVTHVAGDAGTEAFAGFQSDDSLGVRALLHVDSAYSVLLLDTLLLEAPLEQGWAFSFDGHVFYVLNSVLGSSLVLDLTTGQWHRWQTAGRLFWNMFRGITWRGHVLGADASGPEIWTLDPESALDEGQAPIERVVSAFQPVRGDRALRQGSLRLSARRDAVTADTAEISMRFSDDGGKTWSRFFSIQLRPEDLSKRIEFRSLGRLRAPGRVWEFYDAGGLVRIDGADSDTEGS